MQFTRSFELFIGGGRKGIELKHGNDSLPTSQRIPPPDKGEFLPSPSPLSELSSGGKIMESHHASDK